MSYTVIVTEKPSVAREYAKVLGISGSNDGYIEGRSKKTGMDYRITWAVGHLVTMSYPDKYDEGLKKWSLSSLPFIPDKYKYEIISDVKKQYNVIKKLYNSADTDTILYAGDSGREGIYIQMLIRQESGVRNGITEKVVWIDSQTEDEIFRGIKEAKPISAYEKLIDAAYMRAIEDYLVGINFSRALSCKFGYQYNRELGSDKYKPLSVGRVMTCVLGMIVRREREINNFKETVFYKPAIIINNLKGEWRASDTSTLYTAADIYDNKGFLDSNKADAFINTLAYEPAAKVTKFEEKKESKKAPLLYNLAELQNDCTKLFKISPEQTLKIVQELYEKKLTTYPRTDARVLSTAIAGEIATNLKGLTKGDYLPDIVENILSSGSYRGIEKTKYTDDSKITDHYAIIPTGQTDADINGLSESVYQLIVRRFLSIFYPEAVYKKLSVEISNLQYNEKFYMSEKVLVSPGYLEIMGKSEDDSESMRLNVFSEGQVISDASYCVTEGKTNPPKRYTSGSMILAMENAGNLIEDEELREQIKSCGIGTSATRAAIISKLIDNGYIKCDKKSQILSPMLAGEKLYDIVEVHLSSLLSPEMTASWEKGLAQIENGAVNSKVYNDKLNNYVITKVNEIKSAVATEAPQFESEATDMTCPYCGGRIVTTTKGFKCENYSKDDGCEFYFGSISQRKFSAGELKILLDTGKTPVYDNFISKKGTRYSAFITFDKENRTFGLNFPENEESKYSCPKCGNPLIKNRWTLDCDCGFKMQTNIAKKDLTDKEIGDLITNGHTSSIVKGLKSKTGKKFEAVLTRDDDGRISFKFERN